MPLLLDAETHRFAMHLITEWVDKIRDDLRFDVAGINCLMWVAAYHEKCALLAARRHAVVSDDTVLGIVEQEIHRNAELFFTTKWKNRTSDIRFHQIICHHAQVESIMNGDHHECRAFGLEAHGADGAAASSGSVLPAVASTAAKRPAVDEVTELYDDEAASAAASSPAGIGDTHKMTDREIKTLMENTRNKPGYQGR
jgi:hypothetical protein